MTIKLVIKNDDTRANAIVMVSEVYGNGNSYQMVELKGQESAEFWIHSQKSVIVTEVQNG